MNTYAFMYIYTYIQVYISGTKCSAVAANGLGHKSADDDEQAKAMINCARQRFLFRADVFFYFGQMQRVNSLT